MASSSKQLEECAVTSQCTVRTGRADASAEDPQGRLPEETLNADQLRSAFAAKGLSTRDFVALSGAHTVSSLSPANRLDVHFFEAVVSFCSSECGIWP